MLWETGFRGGLAVLLYLAFPAFSDVHRLWERDAGLNLGWPTGAFEYPPLSALYFEPLTLLPSSRWAVAVNGLVMALAAVAVTWALARVAETLHNDVNIRMWVASPALLLFLPINWDVLVVLIALLGVIALYRSRTVVSGALHGAGTVFKIFPGAVVLPVLPLIDGWRKRAMFLASGFVVVAFAYLGYMWLDPDGWRFHLDFASTRVDIESTIWGVFDSVAGFFGGELPIDVINVISTAAIVLALLVLTIWVARVRPSYAEVAVLAITALLVLNKTFKPQYVFWVLPLYAWLALSRAKVRVVEIAAIVAFVVVYFEVPKWINPIETAVRVTFLVLLASDVIRARARRSATPTP